MQIQLHQPNLLPTHTPYKVENQYFQFHLILNIVFGGEGGAFFIPQL